MPQDDKNAIIPFPSISRGRTTSIKHPANLPQIIVTGKQLRHLTTETIKALETANKDKPVLFVRSGQMSRLRQDEKHRPIIEVLTESALRGRLARVATFEKQGVGATTAAMPPMYIVKDILSLGQWSFPALAGVVEIPVLRPDGTILDKGGYDASTALYYWPKDRFVVPAIPQAPSREQVKAAVAIVEETIADFPFDSRASRTNTIALLLTPIVRPSIAGNVPLALLDAPQQGTGKSLLAKVITLIATGRPAAMMAAPDNDEEWRKRITSTLASGATVIVIDNIDGRLTSGSLAAALTVEVWRDRILGLSETIELPQRATWMATGNNLRLGGDIQRRCYWIRLDAQTSTPWLGREFKHPQLLQWADANRPQLVAALLTLARAWFAAGMPRAKGTVLGGFEEWHRTVGGILGFAGIDGLLENLAALYSTADEETAEWAGFLRALEGKYLATSFTTAQLVQDLEATQDLQNSLPSELADDWSKRTDGKVNINRRLGKALSSRLGRRYGTSNHRVEDAGEHQSAKLWRVMSEAVPEARAA